MAASPTAGRGSHDTLLFVPTWVGKVATWFIFALFLPVRSSEMLVFLVCGLMFCLGLYHIMPNKMAVKLSLWDRAVILTNITLTFVVAWLFISSAEKSGHLVGVDSLRDVPAYQVAYVLLWTLSHETVFFCVHSFAHKPSVYNHPLYSHKMHHKFLNTSVWTSFYAHPCDHLFAVLCAAFALPLLMMWVGIDVCVPVVTTFMLGGVTTFVMSHHTIYGFTGDHLTHHQKFTVNYSNFGYFDHYTGSYMGMKFKKRA